MKKYSNVRKELPREYWINDNPFSNYGIEVMGTTGLFDFLELKERAQVSMAGQHGILLDRSGSRYEPREIELDLTFKGEYKPAKSRMAWFRNQFAGNTPARLKMTEGERTYVWDVDWVIEENREFLKWWVERTTVHLVETAPIKVVYLVKGKTASFTTAVTAGGATQEPLLISWGDGEFTDGCREGTHPHTYAGATDDSEYMVIISGVLSGITITTTHTKLYEINY